MTKYLIGIDPGCSGALAVFEDGEPVEWMDMPTVKVGKSSRVNSASVAKFLSFFDHPSMHAYIELVHAMPLNGSVSSFTFGHASGSVEAVVATLGIPYTLVTPQAWKKRAGLIGTDKDAARSRAIQLWPSIRDLDPKGKGQALADALLIARYGEAA